MKYVVILILTITMPVMASEATFEGELNPNEFVEWERRTLPYAENVCDQSRHVMFITNPDPHHQIQK